MTSFDPCSLEDLLTAVRDTIKSIIEAQQHVGENIGDASVITILRRMPKASARTHLSSRQIERIPARLKQEGKYIRHGSARNGSWEVL